MKNFRALGLIISFGIIAHAGDEKSLQPNFKTAMTHLQTSCAFGKKKFDLHLGDDKKEADPEQKQFGYPYFWIEAGKAKPIVALPAKEYNEILFLAPQSKSYCKDTVAFKTRDGNVAIFVKQNNRPFDDKLGVVYYDPSRNKVIASQRNLGISRDVEPTIGGFAVKISDKPTDLVQFRVTVRGRISEATEGVLEYWNLVRRKTALVSSNADPRLTWLKSPYRSYFKSQQDFEKAFGWDSKQGIFKNTWVYRVKEPNCIYPNENRTASNDDSRWFCK